MSTVVTAEFVGVAITRSWAAWPAELAEPARPDPVGDQPPLRGLGDKFPASQRWASPAWGSGGTLAIFQADSLAQLDDVFVQLR